MVLGVFRRILHDEHLAEEVFQATFLVLAGKAGSIRKQHSVASWRVPLACAGGKFFSAAPFISHHAGSMQGEVFFQDGKNPVGSRVALLRSQRATASVRRHARILFFFHY